jgi:hypothetical protein
MFFEGRQCRLRITTGDAVELFGPGGYVGPDVPLPTGLLSVWMDLGLELEFVGALWRAMVSRVVRVCFHYFTPGGEVQFGRSERDLLLVAGTWLIETKSCL